MKNRYAYIALLREEGNGVEIEFPDLPGCLPCGKDMEEAARNAKEALGLHIYGMEQDGEELPEPTAISEIHPKSGETPLMVEVFMPSVRERIKSRFVKKTLSLPAWLAAQADEDGVNCSKLFQAALMDYLQVRDRL